MGRNDISAGGVIARIKVQTNKLEGNMSDLETYQRTLEIKKHIKVFDDLYNLKGEDKSQWHRGKAATASSRADLRRKLGHLADWMVRRNYGEYCAALRVAREELRTPSDHGAVTRLEKIIAQGRMNAEQVVNDMHITLSFSVVTSRNPTFERKTSYFGDHTLGIPPGWLYSVYNRELASVRGGDGVRFIMSAKPRTSPQLDNELYKVVAFKREPCNRLFLEEGWVAKANGITAYGTEFKKAQNLLNRRIRSKIMEAFTNG
jgi:hypothetical protein